MGGKDDGRLLPGNLGLHLRELARRVLRPVPAAGLGLQHLAGCRDAAHGEDVRPAVGKKPVPQDEGLLPSCQLPGHSLHPVSPGPGDDDGPLRPVQPRELPVEIIHHRLEGRGHRVHCAVAVNHRELQEAAVVLERDGLLVVVVPRARAHGEQGRDRRRRARRAPRPAPPRPAPAHAPPPAPRAPPLDQPALPPHCYRHTVQTPPPA